MADFANRLWGERDHLGNGRRAGSLGQLKQRQCAQNDSDLLHAAAQQLINFFPVLRRNIDIQSWTAHTLSMRQNNSA